MSRARSISGVASGSVLSSWADQVAGNNLTAAGSARPTYRTDPKIGAYVEFDGASNYLRAALPSIPQPLTMFYVARFAGASATNRTMLDAGSGNNLRKIYQTSTFGNLNGYAGAFLTVTGYATTWQILYEVINGANSSFTLDRNSGYRGGSAVANGNAGSNAGSGLTLGANGFASPSEFCPCSIADVLIYGEALAADRIASVVRWLRQDLPDSLVFVGDSITIGTGTTVPNGFADLVIANFASKVTAANLGVAGMTMATMATNALTQPATYLAPGKGNNTVVIMGGTNDLIGGATAEDTFANLLLVVQRWKAGGAQHPVVVTMLPRGASVETRRVTYNDLIRNNAGTYGYNVADWASNANMGQAGQNTDLTWYNVDVVHPNDAGAALGAPYVNATITWL
jgi:lysophospholipase L1-like esterase